MRNKSKHILVMMLAVMMLLTMTTGAMATGYYSGTLNIGGRVKITSEPVQMPTPAPEAGEQTEATDAPQAEMTPAVTPEATAEPTPAPETTPDASQEPVVQPKTGVVYKKGDDNVAMIREKPSSDSPRVGKAYHGDIVTALAQEGSWYEVEVNGVHGWMHGGMISFDPELIAEAQTAVQQPQDDAADGVDVRLAAHGLSEIILTITPETAVTITATEGDWVQVVTGGVTGYIYIDDLARLTNVTGDLPQTTPAPSGDEQSTANFKVTIFSSRRSVMMPGETITLTSKLEGFENYDIVLQWECDKGNGFEDVPGANSDTYSFEASIETLRYDWRLAVYYK